jgi:hypothetical protein
LPAIGKACTNGPFFISYRPKKSLPQKEKLTFFLFIFSLSVKIITELDDGI